jgi:hypothetical protein
MQTGDRRNGKRPAFILYFLAPLATTVSHRSIALRLPRLCHE